MATYLYGDDNPRAIRVWTDFRAARLSRASVYVVIPTKEGPPISRGHPERRVKPQPLLAMRTPLAPQSFW